MKRLGHPIPHYHVHALRHEYTTRYRAAGGDERALQRLMGHTRPAMTAEYGGTPDRFIREDAARVFATWEADDSRSRPGISASEPIPDLSQKSLTR